jgi:hypothetical protein
MPFSKSGTMPYFGAVLSLSITNIKDNLQFSVNETEQLELKNCSKNVLQL